MARKTDKPKKRLASIDGIVSDNRLLGEPLPTRKGRKAAETSDLARSASRSDGFHPLRQSPGGLGHVAAKPSSAVQHDDDEPIMLDEKLPKKHRKLIFAHHPRGRHIVKHLGLALSAFLLVGVILFGLNLFLTYKHILHGGGSAPALAKNVDINQLKGEGDGRINVLLLGIGGPGHDGPNLTDTILLASIDPVNHKTALLSVPRDLWVKIPGDGYNKINAAYNYGIEASTSKSGNKRIRNGLNTLDRTLSPILGVPIHYHAIVNFKAFKSAVNAVGGITVKVPERLYDPSVEWENNYNPVIAEKGTQKFNGQKALLYVKSRKTSPRGDFDRSERQRLVMTALKDKVINLGTFSNPIRISQLLNSFGNNVYTDFSLSDLSRLYQIISEVPSKDISSLDLVTPPHQLLTTGSINGTSIDQPVAGLFSYGAIQSYVRNKLRDGFIAKEDAAVAIYNATNSPGLATKEAKVLKSYGYKVTTIANVPNATNPSTTTVVNLSDGAKKYTAHYLENRFHTTAQSKVPDEYGIGVPLNTDFVIILGKDIN